MGPEAMILVFSFKYQKTVLWYSLLSPEPINCSILCSNCCFLMPTQVSQETSKDYSKLKILSILILKGTGIPRWPSVKETACQAGDVGLIPG